MTNAEWETLKQCAILTAFQSGRPVKTDSDGTMHYADGAQERIDPAKGVPLRTILTAPRRPWWKRLLQGLRAGL